MTFTLIYISIGLVLVVMALATSVLKQLPISSSVLYLLAGVAIGPVGAGILDLEMIRDAGIIERVAEIAVVISLFTAGLKLRVNWRDRLWLAPVRLATLSMALTVAMVAIVGVVGLGLPVGTAILLGAVLAPTDPVLASDVQVKDPADHDRLRFGLSGEAGMNDGTAFPFAMLGLGLLGRHELGAFWWRWFAVDVIWAVAAGIGIGLALGFGIGRLVLWLRLRSRQSIGAHDFLVLGLIAISYGAAILVHGYGFLAVFSAGLALRRIEQRQTGDAFGEVVDEVKSTETKDESVATEERTASVHMTQSLLTFNEQLERIGEVAVVVIVGALVFQQGLPIEALWFVPVLFLLIRPIAVRIGLFGEDISPTQGRMMAWFGIRGIGSVYYLTFAIVHGIEPNSANLLTGLVLSTVAVSAIVHGASVTPLMTWYDKRSRV